MGAGKSTVGKVLSTSLGYKFIDIDELIEEKSNKKITDIFSELGEDHFRNLETESLMDLSKDNTNAVISTGGGIVLKPVNFKIIESSGTSIYLKTGINSIWDRIKDDTGRPLLKVDSPYEKARDLLEGRREHYEKADIVVETDNLSPREISDIIIKQLFDKK